MDKYKITETTYRDGRVVIQVSHKKDLHQFPYGQGVTYWAAYDTVFSSKEDAKKFIDSMIAEKTTEEFYP